MTPEEHDYQIAINKEHIGNMLFNIDRVGMSKLRDYLEESDFYTIPASKRYHNTEKGGIAKHCLSVYSLFYNHIQKLGIKDIPHDSIVICSLLHDLCKITPKSINHAETSIERIQKYIKLTNIERKIIKYHMGYYYANEFAKTWINGEYSLKNLSMAQNNPIVKLFHWCDDMDAQFIGVKK